MTGSELGHYPRELNIIVDTDQDCVGSGEYDSGVAPDSSVGRRKLVDTDNKH